MANEVLTKLVVDCSTGEETIIPLSLEEIAQREANAAIYVASESERVAAEEARVALKTSAIAKLTAGEPLTAEEAALLIV